MTHALELPPLKFRKEEYGYLVNNGSSRAKQTCMGEAWSYALRKRVPHLIQVSLHRLIRDSGTTRKNYDRLTVEEAATILARYHLGQLQA